MTAKIKKGDNVVVLSGKDKGKNGKVLKIIKSKTDLPVVVGFGIKTPENSREIASIADGAVVGSAIVEKFADGASVDEICEFVESLASGAHAA